MLYRWIEPEAREARVVVHFLAVDDFGLIDWWTAEHTGTTYCLSDGKQRWTLALENEEPFDLVLRGEHAGASWRLTEQSGQFRFRENENA
jgi:hypothetical protein